MDAVVSWLQTMQPALTFVNAFAVAVGAVLGVLHAIRLKHRFDKLDLTLREHQLRDIRARAEMGVIPHLTAKAYRGRQGWIIDTQLEVANRSNRIWTFAAVYVSIHPLLDRDVTTGGTDPIRIDVPPEEESRRSRCISSRTGMIIEMPPEETEVLNSQFLLPSQMASSILLVRCSVYGTPREMLGFRRGKAASEEEGRFRRKWIEYMNTPGCRRYDYNVFAQKRVEQTEGPLSRLQLGEWYLQAEDGQLDERNTATFREMLELTWVWTREVVVDLGAYEVPKAGATVQGAR